MSAPPNANHYDALIATHPEIERKGKTTGYTSHNGHMFTFLSSKGELGIRLGKEDFETFIRTFNAEQFIQYGKKMNEYAEVPVELISKTDILEPWLIRSFEHVQTLKPK